MRITAAILLSVLALALLTACETDNNNHGYGYHYDVRLPSGLTFRADAALPGAITPEHFERWYAEAALCLAGHGHAYRAPPMVIYVPVIDERYDADGRLIHAVSARYKSDPPLILIRKTTHVPYISERMRHEATHHITRYGDEHPDHGNPGAGVWLCRYG